MSELDNIKWLLVGKISEMLRKENLKGKTLNDVRNGVMDEVTDTFNSLAGLGGAPQQAVGESMEDVVSPDPVEGPGGVL